VGQSKNLRQQLIRGIAGSFGLRIVSIGLAFVLNLILARSLGSEGLGVYALTITWLGILGLLAKLGFPQILVRDVSIYSSQSEWSLLKGLIQRAYQISIFLSFALATLTAIGVYIWVENSQTKLCILTALTALPFSSVGVLNQSIMTGLNKVVRGQLPENLIAPLLMVSVTLGSYLLLLDTLKPEIVVSYHVVIAMIASIVGGYQLNRNLPREIVAVKPQYKTFQWARNSLPFMAFGALYILNSQTDILMLGTMANTKSVGLYVIASRIASLITLILVVSNISLGPTVASLHASGKKNDVKKIIKITSRSTFSLSCVIAVLIILFSNRLLLLFGSDFLDSKNILLILILGQLANSFSGSVGLLLNMTGNEKLSLAIFLASALVNVGLNFYLIPVFDSQGAAIATTTSMCIWNFLGVMSVIKRLGINPTAV
jgi:O-antigen/teichoic acid export membrane protein